jgi:hypothetical protein
VRGTGNDDDLAFVDQDDKADGEPSTFFKLVKRERVGAGR